MIETRPNRTTELAQDEIGNATRDYWLVTIEGRQIRVIGGASDEDEAMHLAEDEVTRLHLGWADRWSPWETEADSSHHANLKDGRELVCYPPNTTQKEGTS
jgi:hypothetical protein